jgi:hypothetical protein
MGSKRKRNAPRHHHDIDDFLEMSVTMARYLQGPGFDGFVAWLDQLVAQAAAACPDCEHPHQLPAVDIPIVRGNLHRLIRALENSG